MSACSSLKQPKKSEVVIEPLAREDFHWVFSTMDTKTVLGARNTAIVLLMFDTG